MPSLMLWELPKDLLPKILRHLSYKQIMGLRLVSKETENMVRPYFNKIKISSGKDKYIQEKELGLENPSFVLEKFKNASYSLTDLEQLRISEK